ncbi:MAG: VOC family protein [Acidimicrobiales bacterium]
MRTGRDAFHLAIPAYDLEAAQEFYVDRLGCKLARRYADRITLDFFGDQVVCHLSRRDNGEKREPSLYPRHFGITFHDGEDFDAVHHLAQERSIPFFSPLGTRFDELVEVHRTFVLMDPSDNLIEFKHYRDPRMMY